MLWGLQVVLDRTLTQYFNGQIALESHFGQLWGVYAQKLLLCTGQQEISLWAGSHCWVLLSLLESDH